MTVLQNDLHLGNVDNITSLVEDIIAQQKERIPENQTLSEALCFLLKDGVHAKTLLKNICFCQDISFQLDTEYHVISLPPLEHDYTGGDIFTTPPLKYGQFIADHFVQNFQSVCLDNLEKAAHSDGPCSPQVFTALLKNNIWAQVRVWPIHNENNILSGFGGTMTGLSLSQRWRDEFSMIKHVFDNTSEGIVVLDGNKNILKINRAFCEITGWDESEILGKSHDVLSTHLYDSICEKQEETQHAHIWQKVNELGSWQGEVWARKKNGMLFQAYLVLNLVPAEENGVSESHIIGVFTDTSRSKNNAMDYRVIANYDPITKLPNRTLFFDRMNHAISQAKKNSTKIGLFFIDLDNFKNINESLGHAAGDQLLLKASERISNVIVDENTLARIGGDEFVLVVENIADTNELSFIGDSILSVFNLPFMIGNNELFISSSIGITVFPNDGKTTEDLLRNADSAMYKAKKTGKNHFQFFTEEMNRVANERLLIESCLHRAVTENELFLVFQPQVDMQGKLHGAEALLRWNSQRMGSVEPMRFIPIAEENGLIVPIGKWIFREALRQSKKWQKEEDFRLGINFSAKQLNEKNILDHLLEVLAEESVSPYQIEIELTETAMMDNPERVREILCGFQKAGFSISVDDFGTGYSSFAYLKKFPISKIKIDKTFVRDLDSDAEDAAIVKAIIAMAHSLNMKVVAEGVENINQIAFLKEHGCDILQGYKISKPVLFNEILNNYQHALS